MYQYKLVDLPRQVKKILVTIPTSSIEDEYKNAFEKIRSVILIPGFRQGKAPRDVAEKHIKKEKVFEELIRNLIPKIYDEIIKKEGIKPIVQPKIKLINAQENKDWEIEIMVAQKPNIDLGKYKDAIKNFKAQNKKADIWVPGKDIKTQPKAEDKTQTNIDEILNLLLKESKIEIAELIVEEELNHRLTQLVDDVQKIGLSMDAYLKSKNLTLETLKSRYTKEIETTYKLEFILAQVADQESIKVEKEDLDKLFANIKDEKERQMAKQNAYFYASILRKQKTIDFLLSL